MQVHEKNAGNNLTFTQLSLAVLSLCVDNEKADELTKRDHRAKNSNGWGLS